MTTFLAISLLAAVFLLGFAIGYITGGVHADRWYRKNIR